MAFNLKTELTSIVENDSWMLNILKIVRDLNLTDCWIGAGFVRNKIWDYKHNKERSLLNDIDVIYFDNNTFTKNDDFIIEAKLTSINSTLNWSVKNQFRMHTRNGHPPYKNCEHAISFWPETATSIAIRINTNNKIEFIAPYGLYDLFNLLVKPTPNFNLTVYKKRINEKSWRKKWPLLSFYNYTE